MTKPIYIINVEGVVYNEGRYLMIVRAAGEKQDPQTLAMPGGKVEQEDNRQDILEETVRREIMEETGIEICAEIHYLESKSFSMYDGTPVLDIVLFCRYQGGEPLITDPDEVEEILWLTAEEIFSHPKAAQFTIQSIRKAEQFLHENP